MAQRRRRAHEHRISPSPRRPVDSPSSGLTGPVYTLTRGNMHKREERRVTSHDINGLDKYEHTLIPTYTKQRRQPAWRCVAPHTSALCLRQIPTQTDVNLGLIRLNLPCRPASLSSTPMQAACSQQRPRCACVLSLPSLFSDPSNQFRIRLPIAALGSPMSPSKSMPNPDYPTPARDLPRKSNLSQRIDIHSC